MVTKNFLFDGPIIKEGSIWHFHVINSKDVSIRNAKVLGRFDMGENDGFDITESQNVHIKRAVAIVWDDSFSTKAYDPGHNNTDVFNRIEGPAMPVKNVLIEDTLAWTGLYGWKVGQGANVAQSNILFRDGVVYDCSRAVGVERKYGPGHFSNITWQNIDVEHVFVTVGSKRCWAMFHGVDVGQGRGTTAGMKVEKVHLYDTGTTPVLIEGPNTGDGLISDVLFKDIYVKSLGRQAHTAAEAKLTANKNVKNIRLAYSDSGSRTVSLMGSEGNNELTFFTDPSRGLGILRHMLFIVRKLSLSLSLSLYMAQCCKCFHHT